MMQSVGVVQYKVSQALQCYLYHLQQLFKLSIELMYLYAHSLLGLWFNDEEPFPYRDVTYWRYMILMVANMYSTGYVADRWIGWK